MRSSAERHIRLDADDNFFILIYILPWRSDHKFTDNRRLPVLLPFGEPIRLLDDASPDAFYSIFNVAVDAK